jgi:acyl carrier protein
MMRQRRELLACIRGVLVDLGIADEASGVDESTGLLGHGLGVDSVEALRIVAAIEDRLDLTIDDEALRREHFTTVAALLDLVEEEHEK